MLSFGFPYVGSFKARVLVLGSLPGRMSLERSEYYANPNNMFWQIVARRFPALPEDYAGRLEFLTERGIALWDVLAAATRSGSLDANISRDAIPNNFQALYHACPGIRAVCFNGNKAAALYRRHVIPALGDKQRAIVQYVLPSTSAAHAKLRLSEKAKQWEIVWA